MKFSCSKDIIMSAVQTTAKAAASKTAIPALEGILFELEGNELSITGYNLDIGIKTTIIVTGEESGSVVINARFAGDIIRRMPSGDISFECDSNNKASISCKDTKFELACISADEYPNIPEVVSEQSVSISQKMLKNMFAQTKYAVAVTDTKPVLMGCKVEIKDNMLNIVASDGIRMALREESIDHPDNMDFIVPAKTVDELIHILTDEDDKMVEICIDKNQISFKIDDYVMISRLIDGDFVNYRNHVNVQCNNYAEVNVREVVDMLERAMLILNDKNKCPIRCTLENDILYMSCSTALGTINDRMAVKYNGAPITIGINAKFMSDIFKACDTDMVKMAVFTPVNPIIVKPMDGNSFTHLVMPMHLK